MFSKTSVMLALIVITGAVAAIASAAPGGTSRLTGPFCINAHTGVVRSVARAKPCLKGEVRKLGVATVAGPQGPTGNIGAAGVAGPQGPKGDTGAAGARGVSGYEVRTWRYSKDDANSDSGPGYGGVGGGAIATVACSPGKVALGGGYWFTSEHDSGFNSSALTDGSSVIASFPGRMDWTTNTVKPNDNSGWIVQVNNKVNAADMTLYVVCVNAN